MSSGLIQTGPLASHLPQHAEDSGPMSKRNQLQRLGGRGRGGRVGGVGGREVGWGGGGDEAKVSFKERKEPHSRVDGVLS